MHKNDDYTSLFIKHERADFLLIKNGKLKINKNKQKKTFKHNSYIIVVASLADILTTYNSLLWRKHFSATTIYIAQL